MGEPLPSPLPVSEFADVMRRLRAECPWKAAQTHTSLARYLLEETHETLEAIDSGDPAHLREELGDLLLQVFLHTAIAEESGEFTLDDVASDATAKMVRRNPHVFETEGPSSLTPAEVNAEWERRKAQEVGKGASSRTSVLDGLPPGLPALLLADKALDRLSRAPEGDAEGDDVGHGNCGSEPAERMTPEEVGERLLALVESARAGGVDAEQALRHAVRRRVGER
ncbi:MAG: nucleoside triphosphate pyrophosphohydrolase [Nocardioides sp.]|nr:nucleoside triphosphate pyrophosphohydrolase [Nocardioides sp.]